VRVNVQKFEFFYFKFEVVRKKQKIAFLDSLYTGFEKNKKWGIRFDNILEESLKMKNNNKVQKYAKLLK